MAVINEIWQFSKRRFLFLRDSCVGSVMLHKENNEWSETDKTTWNDEIHFVCENTQNGLSVRDLTLDKNGILKISVV